VAEQAALFSVLRFLCIFQRAETTKAVVYDGSGKAHLESEHGPDDGAGQYLKVRFLDDASEEREQSDGATAIYQQQTANSL
jgi:hypothetical protein